MPSVGQVRPAQCPSCEGASQPAGEGIVLHGHGLRERQLRGPAAPGEPAAILGVQARRYRCRRCKAICIVVPAEMLPWRLYSASAIALALSLFGALRLSPATIRERVSPWKIVGASAGRRWVTLLRWTDAVVAQRLFRCVRPAPLSWARRRVAERAATTIAGHAPPSTGRPLEEQAFLGAARAA